ncbi:hypothetical protein HPB50_010147 [Hyalomma asiaticum]|uniref:Uncharacterized protein n=1 Tax=Hyalomma asiaticum TaxID=266040 RepID=A0ACB7SFH4_HYAAI|nr:hypothetical protein HPB50_010147 [Hyalomma asiaticum]
MVPLGCALVMSSFVLQPTAERASGAKDLQLMTGLSGATYWSANWIFDFFVYLFAWAAVCALISFYQPFLVVTKCKYEISY